MHHTSVIEINRTALKENLRFIRKLAGSRTAVSSVIKGNAYGHGIESFVPIAQECGQHHFSVYSADEAYRAHRVLREPGTIVIMGMIDQNAIPWAIRNDIEFYVFDRARLDQTLKAAKRLNKAARIHIEVETGLNRTGFNEKELPKTLETLQKNCELLDFKGLCTHYAGAESIANYFRVIHQMKRFKELARRVAGAGLSPELLHTACSAAAIRYPATRMDMVRIGIMQYGYWPNTETLISHVANKKHPLNPLKRIITWKSRIMSVKKIKAGEFIGYGSFFLASKDTRIAVIPLGYTHGFSRSLSNQGRVLVRGRRVGVVGVVNMNCVTVDVTAVPQVRPGDEVVIIGDQGKLSISVASFSEMSNQMNYELLTRLPKDIPRIVTD